MAAAAGVSTATVSRVLNTPERVRQALRERVTKAVLKLGYVPHAGARALKLQRSGTVGAIFPTVDNSMFAKAVDALQRRLAGAHLQLLIATSGYDVEIETQQAINLVARGVDAMALCGVWQSPRLMQVLRQRELPTVHAMSFPAPEGAVCVGFDNFRAMTQAVRYLLDLGHRRIAMLAGITRDNDRATARVKAVRHTLAASRVSLPPSRLIERAYTLADGREGFRTLMTTQPAPTAILCGNDVLAIGALLEAQAMGIAVPGTVSVIGFDDIEMARHLRPALTTLHVPTESMWSTVADRLIAALEHTAVPLVTEVDVELLVRESTGPAPRK